MSGFVSLFALSATHEFFGGPCPALLFVPTEGCRRLAGNTQVLLRADAAGVAAFYEEERCAALPEMAGFDFHVLAVDGDFPCYTDLPPRAAGQLFRFDSGYADGAGRLSREAYVSAADLPPASPPPAPAAAPGRVALGLVRVRAGARTRDGRRYELPFRARRTIWEYLIDGSGIDGTGLAVTAPDGAEEFDYRGEMDLPGGRSASLFRSRRPLPLLQEPRRHFALRERANGRLVVRKLPLPAPCALARQPVDEGEVLTSQIFVNL